jgi:Fic-DOC domain mobile mystery protein B
MKFSFPEGATPLDADAAADLLEPGITTQAELNQLEQANIVEAHRWTLRMKPARLEQLVLTPQGLRELHRRMFDEVWKWAGHFRRRDLSIGCNWYEVETRMHELCNDTRAQADHAAIPWDEIGVRFHHRLVSIHPFVNGNGRHSRMAADLLMRAFGQSKFTWGGGGDLVATGETRSRYIAALKQADQHDITALLEFARS